MTNLVTSIDELATETILEIFEYLSSNDIIYAFFDFNQRFNSILFHHQYCLNDFKTPTTNIYLWQNILLYIGLNIEHLVITTISPYFSLDLFPNLKSMIISSPFPIDHGQIYSLTENKQFNQLISFKIQSEIYYKEFRTSVFENIFHHENSLQIFQSTSKLYFSCFNMNKLMINKNIISLSLKLTSYISVFSIFPYVPNLKYFNLTVNSIDTYDQSNKEFDLSQIKLEKFNFLCKVNEGKNNIVEERFRSLLNLIKHFSSSLIYLSMDISEGGVFDTSTVHFDGNFLQKQLLESMIHLKIFHFYVKLEHSLINVQHLLPTFENQFWFDHEWSIGIHGKYIYTLPFHFNKLHDFTHFDHIKSNDFLILNSPSTWYRVKSIHFSENHKLDSNLIEQLKLKTPNLTSISRTKLLNQYFRTTENSYSNDNELNSMDTTLDTVTAACFIDTSSEINNKWLINILPNITYLIVSREFPLTKTVNEKITRLKILNADNRNQNINTCDVYLPNLEHIEIQSRDFMPNYIMKILKSFNNLKTLMLYFYGYNSQYMNSERTEFCNKFDELDLITILEQYQIKPGYDCLQFINKTK